MQLITYDILREKITDKTLAELLRDLIRATVSFETFEKFDFPTSNLCGAHGFDAQIKVQNTHNHPYLPSGYSCWELGITDRSQAKADDDYSKRKGFIKATEATFVFVTPREFNKREDWIIEKKKDDIWNDIKVLNGHNLIEWLHDHPAIEQRWAEKWDIIESEDRVYSIESFWEEWKFACEEALPLSLVKALGQSERRTDEDLALHVKKWLHSEDSDSLSIGSSAVDESRLYLASVLLDLKEDERKHFLAKTICTDDKASYRKLAKHKSPLIIVTPLLDAGIKRIALKNKHRVCQVLRRSNALRETQISLPLRIHSRLFSSVLIQEKFSTEQREHWESISGRNLSSLRNSLGTEEIPWANQDSSGTLIAALLVGGWNADKEEDREALTILAGEKDYTDFEQKLAEFINVDHPPLQCEAPYWRVISPFSAWRLVSNHLNQGMLDRFREVCLKILGAPDEVAKLPHDKRAFAGILEVTNSYSNIIRRSLSESIILLALTLEERIQTLRYDYSKNYVPNLVNDIIAAHDPNWESIAATLQDLAEAAPETVLCSLEAAADSDLEHLNSLAVKDGEDILLGASLHTHILWAVELIAWNEHLFARSARLLILLSRCWCDLAQNMGNRPMNSFIDLFSTWLPQTNASLEIRMTTLEDLYEEFPDEIWPILLKLLPNRQQVISPSVHTKWRGWTKDTSQTVHEYRLSSERIYNLALVHSRDSVDRAIDLLGNIKTTLPQDWRKKFYDTINIDFELKEDRMTFWSALRGVINQNRSFPDAKRTLPEDEVTRLEKLYDELTPTDPIDRNAWLFVDGPEFLEGTIYEEGNFQKTQELIKDTQRKALQNIYRTKGVDGFFQLLTQCADERWGENIEKRPDPYIAAYQISEYVNFEINPEKVFEILGWSVEQGLSIHIQNGLLSALINNNENDQLGWMYDKAKSNGNDIFIIYLCSMQVSEESLNRIDQEAQSIKKQFWEQVSFFPKSIPVARKGIKGLIEVGRIVDAVSVAHRAKDAVSFATGSLLLKMLLNNKYGSQLNSIRQYELTELIKSLGEKEDCNIEELAYLEWAYFPLLENSKSEAKHLFEKLSQSPVLFIDIVSHAFKSTNGNTIKGSSESTAKNAYHVLNAHARESGWLLNTFRNEDDELKGDKLIEWCASVLELAKKSGHYAVVQSIIGQQLSHSRPDSSDEAWPEITVRRIIEKYPTDELFSGVMVGWNNKRGMFSGSRVDHSRNMKDEVDNNIAKLRGGFRNTSRLLNELSQSLEADIERAVVHEAQRDMV